MNKPSFLQVHTMMMDFDIAYLVPSASKRVIDLWHSNMKKVYNFEAN